MNLQLQGEKFFVKLWKRTNCSHCWVPGFFVTNHLCKTKKITAFQKPRMGVGVEPVICASDGYFVDTLKSNHKEICTIKP